MPNTVEHANEISNGKAPLSAWRRVTCAFRADARVADVSSSERWLRWLVGLAVALPVILYGALGWYLSEAGEAEALKRLERVVLATQEHASKVLDTNVMMLGRVHDLIDGMSNERIRAREPELHQRMRSITAAVPQVVSFWLVDDQGRTLATDRYSVVQAKSLDLSDRDYFIWHQEGGRGLYISEPGIGRLTRSRFFNTSLAREHEGRFAGTVHASLDRGYFSRFYAALAREEPTLIISLFRSDGVLLARHPELPDGIVHRLPADSELMQGFSSRQVQGSATVRSAFDGVERLIAFRAVERYPVYLIAGIETSHLRAQWQREMMMIAAFMLPLCAALILSAWVALRRARREHEALLQVRTEVDQRLRAEGALLRTQKLQALGQITGSVAHDFNNLLAVVSNCAHLILRRGDTADPTPQAAAIERAVRNGVHLTRQLLAFSRRQALRPEQVNLPDTLPRTVELLRTSVSGRVKVELTIEPGVAPICIDPADLELALLNLVLNARDALPEGGQVTLRARNLPPAASVDDPAIAAGNAASASLPMVEISVTDNGSGIPAQVIDRVFEPFFTTKDQVNGTGLGLYQVRTACEQAGGSVRIDSTPGIGTSVRLLLPAQGAASMLEVVEPEDQRLSCSVLLVEDDVDVGSTTAALLVSMGATVERVGNAAEALRLLDSGIDRHDVVLSDVAMPGALNGLGLAQQLRRTRPQLGIVLMTGFTSEYDIAVADGFAVLSKPFDPGALSAKIGQACREAETRKARLRLPPAG